MISVHREPFFLVLFFYVHFVAVMQVVTLNRRRVLREIELSTELVIRSEGVNRVSDGKYTSWISVEVPAHWNTGGLAGRVIFGRPRTTEQDASEDAAAECIKWIVSTGRVVVNDTNYEALRASRTQLRYAGHLFDHRDAMASRMSLQIARLMRDKKSMLINLAHACTNFDDVLPIKVVETPDVSSDVSAGQLEYTGKMLPETRQEQLACFIVHGMLGPEYTKIRPVTSMDELD